MNVFSACMAHECAAECVMPTSLACGVTIQDAACATCAQAQCCAEMYAASQSSDYWVWTQCYSGCGTDTVCMQKCDADHPAGSALYVTYGNCLLQQCWTACGS